MTGVDTPAGPRPRPWLTVWLTLAAILAAGAASIPVILIALVMETADGRIDAGALVSALTTDGDMLSAFTWAGFLVQVPLVLWFARAVSGPRAASHLGLRLPGARSLAMWLLVTVAFVAAVDTFTWLVGHDVVTVWMRDTYASTQYPVLLWATLLVAAPVGEELLFRGFLFEGLARSPRVGRAPAAVIASLAWATMHLQYDLFGMVSIFVSGLLLAAARHATRSVVPCIAMHALWNLIATAEMMWLEAGR